MAVDSEVKPLRITIGSDDAGVSYKKAISADLIADQRVVSVTDVRVCRLLTKLLNVFHHSSGHTSHPATPLAPKRVFVQLFYHNALNLIKRSI